ncbi:MAG: DUF3169 family protein [Lachnospiraceae bacterium]|nr:DUF3169 family protein [Lachnospiraceae bacterium]
MSESKKNKKKNKSVKQLLLIFLLVLAGCFIGGFLSGVLAAWLKDTGEQDIAAFIAAMDEWSMWICPAAVLVVLVVGVTLGLKFYFRGKRSFESWDGEDEKVISGVERDLNYSLMTTNTMMILNMFFLAAWLTSDFWVEAGMMGLVSVTVLLVSYLIGFTFIFVSQYKVIELEKKINPEKRGNLLDFGFTKKWEGSCDEREMMIRYRASYKAFKRTNTLCMVLWLICLIGETVFSFGVFPVLMITIIWLVLQLTYQIEAMKLENS